MSDVWKLFWPLQCDLKAVFTVYKWGLPKIDKSYFNMNREKWNKTKKTIIMKNFKFILFF